MLNRRTEPILVITCGLTQVLNKKINQTIKHKSKKIKTMSKDIRKMIDKVKNFKQFVNENITEIDKSINLSKEISQSIKNIDDSMSYKDFAKAVAYVLVEEYGSHNYQPFLDVLNEELNVFYTEL